MQYWSMDGAVHLFLDCSIKDMSYKNADSAYLREMAKP